MKNITAILLVSVNLIEGTMKVKLTKPLQGKVAIVTGAARGIGRAAAIAFAQDGADIVGIDICSRVLLNSDVSPSTPEDLRMTGSLVKQKGVKWLGVIADQRNIKKLREIAKKVEQRFGKINILFANAGIQDFKSLLEMDDIFWNTHIDVNLTGTANTIRAFAPHIIKNPHGRVIITSSTQGRHGMKNGAAYSASKWGLIGLMKSAALELGKYGTTVNCVIPGLIDTPLTRHETRYEQAIEESGNSPSGKIVTDEKTAKALLKKKSPMGIAWIEPTDVAQVVAFLATDKAKMISGASYEVTAGDSAHF